MSAVPRFAVMSDEDVDLQSWGWTDLCVSSLYTNASSVVLAVCVCVCVCVLDKTAGICVAAFLIAELKSLLPLTNQYVRTKFILIRVEFLKKERTLLANLFYRLCILLLISWKLPSLFL